MIVLQILALGIWLVGIPFVVGEFFIGVDKQAKKPVFRWISGQICLWAGFQLICVPMVLMERNFSEVAALFACYAGLMLVTAAGLWLRRRHQSAVKQGGSDLHMVGQQQTKNVLSAVLWAIFALLLLFQLVQAVRMTYADGDDAFYVAVTTITQNADTMYRKLPYTGGGTTLDARHGLAPFPVWISFLAQMTGIKGVTVAHVAVPVVLIAMTYGIFYLLGSRLFAKKSTQLPLFLIFTELLVLFGDYSFYTVENFMIARSRQGKAALGNIIIPVLLLLLFILLDKLQEKDKISAGFWVLLCMTMTAGCLCSTLGAFLTCMLIGLAGVCGAVCYRRWRFLLPMVLCCTPCVCYAVLYLLH